MDLRAAALAATLSVMDPGELIALLGLLLGGVTLAGGLFGAWALGRIQGERQALDARETEPSDARLARIERMIEAMALDMERLAESQRFVARQLPRIEPRAETQPAPGSSPRV
jgi:hypothetical protein